MKYLLNILIIFSFSNCFSQNEFDYPVVNLKKEDGKIIWFNEIHDSVRVDINTTYIDYDNSNKPAEYTVTIYQTEEFKFQRIIILSTVDSSQRMSSGGRIPEQCQYWEKVDTSQYVFVKPKNKFMGSGYGSGFDSIISYDNNCIQNFYKFDNDTVNTDTIYFDGYFSDYYKGGVYEFINKGIWSCAYYYEIKHGREEAYYSVNELSNQVVIGELIGLKYSGSWKYGKKQGKWMFYDKSGTLIKKEKYKKGKLKKTWSL